MRAAVILIASGLLGLATCGDDRYVLETDRVTGEESEPAAPGATSSPVAEYPIGGPAVASGVSDRLSPPAPTMPPTTTTTPPVVPGLVGTALAGTCSQYEYLLALYPGWDVERMSKIMWRESMCEPGVISTTRDWGLLQVHWENPYWTTPMQWGFGTLPQECGMTALSDLLVPEINVRCVHALYRARGMAPWALGGS